MDFFSQYKDMQLLAEGETKTFRARQAVTHRPVLLHQLSSNPRSGRQLHLLALVLRYTSTARPEGHNPILGIEEQADSVWVVTDDLPDLVNLWDWMERQFAQKAAPEATPADSPASKKKLTPPSPARVQSSTTLDEKTAIFATRLASADANPLVEFDSKRGEGQDSGEPLEEHAPLAPALSEGAPTPSHAATGPREPVRPGGAGIGSGGQNRDELAPVATTGSSTLFIQTGPGGQPGQPVTETRTSIISPPVNSGLHGEFTMIFQKPPSQDSSAQTPVSAPGSESDIDPSDKPGKFTKTFQSPPAQDFSTQAPVSAPRSESGIDPNDKPGEFTMLFRRPANSSAAGEQKPRFMGFTAPTQEKTKFIETSKFKIQNPVIPEEKEAMGGPEPSPSETPQPVGDFTVMFRSPGSGGPASPQTEPQSLPDFPGPKEYNESPSLQPGEFTQVFQTRPPARDTVSQTGGQHEPGAFTRIFQIPVGSDLLTAAESQTVRSNIPASSTSPVWRPETPSIPLTEAPANFAPASPVAPASAPPSSSSGLPGIPAGIRPPAMPRIPQAPKPEMPHSGGAAAPKIPSVNVPKAPSIAAPKAPKMPGLEKAKGMPGPSILPLILVFGGIILVAVFLVLFFVTKH